MATNITKSERIYKLLEIIILERNVLGERMNKLVQHNNTSNGAYDKCALRRTQLSNRFKLLYNCL